MQDFINFILDNYKWLIVVVLSIVVFILQIVKPQSKIAFNYRDYYIAEAVDILPTLINEAEEKFPHEGSKKLQYVLIHVFKHFGMNQSLLSDTDFVHIITMMIEGYLSTPEKKGGN